MSTIEQIETAILTLAPDEFQQLRQWFADVDYHTCKAELDDGKCDRQNPLPRAKKSVYHMCLVAQ